MFVNYSNHKSGLWSIEQFTAAMEYVSSPTNGIVDLPYPDVNPTADEAYIQDMADKEASRIAAYNPDAVLCQGEMTLCFAVVRRLIARGITVLAACSCREVQEQVESDGSTSKQSRFVFVRFRRYE